MKYSIILGILTGFSIGFFVAITLFTILNSQIMVRQSLFQQCYRSEFVLHTANEHWIGTSIMSC